jgi:hypothetical protein
MTHAPPAIFSAPTLSNRHSPPRQAALAGVFGAVLGLCAKAGLVGVNVVAVDGSKVSGNASREVNVDYERLAREILEDARAVDAAEDERFGDRRGDELPPEVATSNGRQQWFKEAKRWLDDQRAAQAAPIPRDRRKRIREAKRRLDEELWTELRAEEAYQRYRTTGRDRRGGRFGPAAVPRPYTPPAVPQGTINTTDLDSRLVKGQHGWLQGYNAQAAANEHQIVIAAEIHVVSPDFGHLEPMVYAACRELQSAGISELPGAVIADSGYWHTEQIQRLNGDGIPVLIRPESGLRTTPRPGWRGGIYDFMRHTLATEHGKALYRQRQHIIKSIFGNTKHNRGITEPSWVSRRPDYVVSNFLIRGIEPAKPARPGAVGRESSVRSNSRGGRSPSAECRRMVLNQPTHSTTASSSWLRLRQTRSAISSVLKESTKLSASALS